MPIPMKVKLSTEKGLSHDTLAYRLSEVLTKLNQGESLDPKALADEFGVNLRTIQRDLNVRFAGLPLIKANGRYKMDEAQLGKLSIRDIERFAAFSGVSGLFPEMSGQFLKEVFASNAHDAWLVKGHHYEDVREHRAMFVSLEQAIVEKHTVADPQHAAVDADDIQAKVLWLSTNIFAYPFMKASKLDYHKLVAWVAEEAGVGKPIVNSASTFTLERELFKILFAQLWDKMTTQQRQDLLTKVDSAGLIKDKAAMAALGGAGALAALSTTVW